MTEHVHHWWIESPKNGNVYVRARCQSSHCPDQRREFEAGWDETSQRRVKTKRAGAKVGATKVHGGWR